MSAELNFFDTYVLMAIVEEIVPRQTFFKDRYFPTGDGDIFASDKVLTEYRKGDRKMAAFVSSRAGDIPMERRGYEIHELQPAFIAPSRLLTMDDLRKRGFGEAIYANSTPAQRAARLQRDDLSDMDIRITRREEWMAVQTMINNSCTMQSYIDDTPTTPHRTSARSWCRSGKSPVSTGRHLHGKSQRQGRCEKRRLLYVHRAEHRRHDPAGAYSVR